MFSSTKLRFCRKCLEERTVLASIDYVMDEDGLEKDDENGQLMQACSGCGEHPTDDALYITEQAIMFILWGFANRTNKELLADVVKTILGAADAAEVERVEAEAKNPRLRLAHTIRGILGT